MDDMHDKINSNEQQNVYAKKIDDTPIHISDAKSGRNGYYCLGCGGIMQAKKGELMIHHFSHEPKDVTRIGKCTYSDETHRHKLAKEILQRIKQIKVPIVYKYPPKGYDGSPNKVKDSEVIYAHKVENELYFYEEEDGSIKCGREDIGFRLLIKPDVSFFDVNNNPILLIEIVATHKVDEEKQAKLRRLGISTVQVLIPKDSPIEIESTFYKTEKTKWIYNYEEAQFKYIPIHRGDTEGIFSIDKLERRFFEESFKCRKIRLKNIIRGVRKTLESEQYQSSEQAIRGELSRVEKNTEQYRERLRRIQDDLQREIDGQFSEATERLKGESLEFEKYYSDLEGRYQRKKEEIRREEDELRRLQNEFEPNDQFEVDRIERLIEELGIRNNNIGDRIGELRSEKIRVERDLERQRDYEEQLIDNFEFEKRRIEERRNGLSDEFREKEENIRREFSVRIEELSRKFESDRDRTFSEIENRVTDGFSELTRRIKRVLDERRHLDDIFNGISDKKRMRTAKDLFEKKSWKDW